MLSKVRRNGTIEEFGDVLGDDTKKRLSDTVAQGDRKKIRPRMAQGPTNLLETLMSLPAKISARLADTGDERFRQTFKHNTSKRNVRFLSRY